MIEAEDEDEAREIAGQYDEEFGFDPQEIEEVDFIVLREANDIDKKDRGWEVICEYYGGEDEYRKECEEYYNV